MLRDDQTGLYREEYFSELLALEKKRCERSEETILLMLFDLTEFEDPTERSGVARLMMVRLSNLTRQTDIKGWHADDSAVGVIFTDVMGKERNSKTTPQQIINKCCGSLGSCLGFEQFSKIKVSWQVFPGAFPLFVGKEGPGQTAGGLGSVSGKTRGRVSLLAKRFIDIAGSFSAIVFLAPVFIGVSLLIKMSSEGPVLFRQERIGLGGKKFMVLKFRSMSVNNDTAIHKEYIKKFMTSGNNGSEVGQDGVFKIRNDPRVTPIGRILRKTSMDELPQFFNVLKGDMSLVGPRPPIEYECEDYDVWHRRRVLDMKPGITGLWQVTGRSSTTFDEMVRLDIKYVREWSIWLDMKIILKTPVVILLGDGAY